MKPPRFRRRCGDFLDGFLIEAEKNSPHTSNSIEETSRNLKAVQATLQTLMDELAILDAEEADLKRRLAEVQHRQEFKNAQ